MIEMTQTARERFDAYLLRLRRAFLGSPQVEADEVEQNVREHIEIALLAPVGGMLLLVPAYVVSRAVVGAKKWLIYPAIVMLAVVVGVAILMAPPAAAVAWSLQERGLYRTTGLTRTELLVAQRVQLETGLIMAAYGIWWVIASLILLAIHRPLQIAFRPVLDRGCDSRRDRSRGDVLGCVTPWPRAG